MWIFVSSGGLKIEEQMYKFKEKGHGYLHFINEKNLKLGC